MNSFDESNESCVVDSGHVVCRTSESSSGIIHAGTCTSIGVLNSSINTKKETVLHKLGGKNTLRIAVDQFYDRLVHDKTLEPYFSTTNIQILKWHQFNFMSIAFSDETVVPEYFDMSTLILSRHKHLFEMGLNETHFDIMMMHFVATLQNLNIKDDLIEEALFMLSPVRRVFIQGALLAQQKKLEKDRVYQSIQITTIAVVIGIGISRYFHAIRRNR